MAVLDQTPADTRRRDAVLNLKCLPGDFAHTVNRVTTRSEPGDILVACEQLLDTTRDLLLREQLAVGAKAPSFPEVLGNAYPEFRGDLNHIRLACERENSVRLNEFATLDELEAHS